MSDEPRIFVTVTRFVSVSDKDEEIISYYGFTIWDGEANHFYVSGDWWWDSAAGVFEVLRGPDALQILERIDNYDVGFAEIARMSGGFSINANARPRNAKVMAPPPSYEEVKVNEKPRCFGAYPLPFLNWYRDRDFDCDSHCFHENECRKQKQKGTRGGRRCGP